MSFGQTKCMYTGSTPTTETMVHNQILFLVSPIADVSLSSYVGGAISTQSFFGYNPTKRNLA